MEEDFQVPVCQGLIKPLTILGVSREAMILNVALGASFVIAVRAVYMLPIFLSHIICCISCVKEILWLLQFL